MHRIGLDGKNLVDLTPEPANHNARFNADYTALIDTYSTVDSAPVTVVRSIQTAGLPSLTGGVGGGSVLARSSIADLLAAGSIDTLTTVDES